MKWLVVTITALVFLTFGRAQNLTGRWVGPGSTADNGQEFVLAVTQSPDGSLSGYIQAPRFEDRIIGGRLEGSNLTLEVERAGRGGAIQKLTYTGTVDGSTIKLTLPAPAGRGGPSGQAAVSVAGPAVVTAPGGAGRS